MICLQSYVAVMGVVFYVTSCKGTINIRKVLSGRMRIVIGKTLALIYRVVFS